MAKTKSSLKRERQGVVEQQQPEIGAARRPRTIRQRTARIRTGPRSRDYRNAPGTGIRPRHISHRARSIARAQANAPDYVGGRNYYPIRRYNQPMRQAQGWIQSQYGQQNRQAATNYRVRGGQYPFGNNFRKWW